MNAFCVWMDNEFLEPRWHRVIGTIMSPTSTKNVHILIHGTYEHAKLHGKELKLETDLRQLIS